MNVYLTFDIGTTGLKTALISDDGRLISIHTVEYTPLSPKAGWAELPADVYWHAAVEGTHEVLRNSGVDAEHISAIGLSSQGQTFIPIDRHGKPLRNAIVWVDTRADEIAERWENSWLSKDSFRRITGFPELISGLTIFKLAWLRENEPETLDAWKFLCLPDYLIYRMTGETATDSSIALCSGLYNLGDQEWEHSLVQAASISKEQLPNVLPAGTIAGRVTEEITSEIGIPSGVPVCVGVWDQLAGALGAGNVCSGVVTETTGTALALIVSTDERIDDSAVCVGRHVVSDKYYAMSFASTSGIVLKWFRDLCASDVDYNDFLKGVESISVGSDGLVVLPHFAGVNSPYCKPDARGALVGLTLGHTRTHICRAIMESCAFLLRDCLDPIERQGIQVTGIRSLGGAARNDAWLQMKADLLGIPIERPQCSDAASLGAAMLAAVGNGQFASVEEASKAWYKPSKVFMPNKDLFADYRSAYENYTTICKKLYGI